MRSLGSSLIFVAVVSCDLGQVTVFMGLRFFTSAHSTT